MTSRLQRIKSLTVRTCRATLPALLLGACFFGVVAANAATTYRPAIILDTDLSTDVDDVGAVAVLHALADRGEVDILAMMISSGDPYSGPCLQVLNTSFGRPDVPIGVIAEATVIEESKYTGFLAEHTAFDISGYEAQEATALYRQVLAAQPDHSVTVVTIGYLSNLFQLLASGPDQYSPLDGTALVQAKVERLVCMGGQFPAGKEWNFYRDAPATLAAMNTWPTPIDFVGFEFGSLIRTGEALRNAPEDHPLRMAYQRYNTISNRESWDQAAVLIAAGAETKTGEPLWAFSTPGRVRVAADGSNGWQMALHGIHRYVLWNGNSRKLAGLIDRLMLEAADPQSSTGSSR